MARKKKRQYGTGCLLPRGRRWAIRWREQEIASDGSVKRILRYENLGSISRTEAARILAQRIVQAGTPTKAPVRMTFCELAESWLAQVLPMYKHSTQKNHRHILAKHLVPYFGETALVDLGRQHVQTYVAGLLRQGYAPKTIDHIHDVLSAVLRTAVKWGYLSDNPARQVELPALVTVRPKWALTEAQASLLLMELPPLARTMTGLALLTGLRRGEIFALRWEDLGPEDNYLNVDEAVYEGRFNTPKTAAGVRRIPLSPLAQALLREWRKRAKRTGPGDLVFATWSGKPISPNNVLRSAIFPACDRLKLPRATWLTFRRSYASWAHQKGVAGKTIAALMGHAKVDMTLNVYAQVLDGAEREAATRVGNGLFTIVHEGELADPVSH